MSRAAPAAGTLQGSGPEAPRTPDAGAAALDARLLAAHAAGDLAALTELYAEAAALARAQGETERAAFYLVQAYVFALDEGDPAAEGLRARLRAMGREH